MNMPRHGIFTGVSLILLGLVSYFVTARESWTALIPAIFGSVIFLSSLMATRPALLKTFMHIAALIALLGVLSPLGRLIPALLKGTFALNAASVSMIAMMLLCGWFLFLAVQSFRQVRRDRALAANTPPKA